MRLSDISINNLRRRKAKMSFLVLGLAIGVATVVALVTIASTMKADIDIKLDEYGANILVAPKFEELLLSYGGMMVPGVSDEVRGLREDDISKIESIKNRENLSTIAPKVVGVVAINGRKALLVGVNFKAEFKQKKWWRVKGAKPSRPGEILLGNEVAKKLGRLGGQKIVISGQQFPVRGVLEETGGQEDTLVFADLATAQTVLGKKGKLSFIEISALCNTCPIEEIVAQISKKLPYARVSAVKQAVQSKMDTLSQFTQFSLVISILVVFIGSLIVLTTMMSSVNERTREIGIFRAIGFRRSHIIRVILLEAFVVSVVGGVAGYLVGLSVAWLMAQRMTELSASFVWDPFLAVLAVALSVGVGLLASLYPALYASKLDPVEALRSI